LISFLLARANKAREVGPSLVVCPSSLVYNWLAEFNKFAPQLDVRVIAGTPQERAEVRRQRDADVLITSYDLLRRDVQDYEDARLWCVALDEAQYIKNPATQSARAVKALRARFRVALTGTPVENRLSELWSIFDFLMPGLLGSYDKFRERYERPIVEDEDAQTVGRLREAVRPFILRRAKADVAQDLPEKIEQVVRAHMGTRQRMLYDAQVQEVRNQVARDDDGSFGSQKFQVLALLTRLRQVCCDPRLLYEDYADASCKTETIITLVERVVDAGEKMLLFSQFTSYLDVLAAELGRRGIPFYTIVGSTPSSRRVELVNKFNDDDTPVFLISLKAGGTGLNLTGATVVVHADPWWNVAAQNQATDRAHRIGQTREVTVYEVIAAGTIEERILELQRTKAELADAVVQGDVSSLSLSSLTREDLEELLA
ncbi:MAG: DEAD/DEAH box helicase, partial [Atopobiaceae bacterium]|nr:DEAD/DEAH box helicase [Atopobiaceae bacterium]